MNKDWQKELFERLLELAKGNVPKDNWTEEWKDLMEFKRKHLPRCLLRFRPIENDNDLKFRQSEIDGVLYFSDVRKQNDPVDSSLLSMNSDKSIYNELVKDRVGDAVNSGYIVCFNESPIDSLRTLPMWAHYAKDHKGCCMKYDNISAWPTEWQDALFPVKYIPEDDYFDYLKEFKIGDDVYIHGCDILSKYIMINKLDTWSYEQEWRIILDKNLLNKFSKMPDKNIRIHPAEDMPNEQGIPLFGYKNWFTEDILKTIKKEFEVLLIDNGKYELGNVNYTLNKNEPRFRGISMYFLQPSEIILGKSIDGNYKNKLITHCRDNTIEVVRNMSISDIIFEDNRIKLREVHQDMNLTKCDNGIIDILKGEAYLEGVKKTIIDLVKEQLLSISDAAKKLNVSEIEFKRLMEQQ